MRAQEWVVSALEPHVQMRLKNVFRRIRRTQTGEFRFPDLSDISADLRWFTLRYPLEASRDDLKRLTQGSREKRRQDERLSRIFQPDYDPPVFKINGELRPYQAIGVDLFLQRGRLLCGDDVGLGKTLIGIGALVDPRTRPAVVVVQAHLQRQWAQQIIRFLSMKPCLIKKASPYELPRADVYIMRYSQIGGWVDYFKQRPFKAAIFDEMQELRREDSQKYRASRELCRSVERILGLTATPVYNYGDEMFAVMDLIEPGCLGESEEFRREWTSNGREVRDPKALGTYLRERHLFIRRTREMVGKEMPPINRIVHTVESDDEAIEKVEDLARALAIKTTTGSFFERGEAARELDMLMRKVTGVAKARFVAQYVRILAENGRKVLLAGWHREVYDIWQEELSDLKPVLYTGSESAAGKERSKEAFVRGDSQVMCISLRSGAGLDGLQGVCSTLVFGELDWSPKVHDQVIGRLQREGQTEQVDVIFLVSDSGSDPVVVDLLGIKASQSDQILDPEAVPTIQLEGDMTRIQAMAQAILRKGSKAASEDPRPPSAPGAF